MKISIVIPNYNGEELLKKNLPKVLEVAKKTTAEVIIVDDGSTDSSVRVAESLEVKVFKNLKNSGFSTTVNKGVESSKGDVIVLLNTDVYPEKDFLAPLSTDFKDKNVFAVGFLDKSKENGKLVLRGRGIGKWQKGFLVHSKGDVRKSNTLWASGGAAAFRKSIWEKLGGLDELYSPFYWEDIDISYRALKSGYKIIFDTKCAVYHDHKKGAIKTYYSEFDIKTIAYKNQFIFAWKNGTDFLLQFNQIFFLPYHLLKALGRRDWAFILGFLKAMAVLPKIIRSSLKAQEIFVKNDEGTIKEFKL